MVLVRENVGGGESSLLLHQPVCVLDSAVSSEGVREVFQGERRESGEDGRGQAVCGGGGEQVPTGRR